MSHPETNHDQIETTEEEEREGNVQMNKEQEIIMNTYTELVDRIDRFLNDLNPSSASDIDRIRRGTQLKVRESLQVIKTALDKYGYFPLFPSPTLSFSFCIQIDFCKF